MLRRSVHCMCVFHEQATRTKSCRAMCVIRTYIALLSYENCVNPFQGDFCLKTKRLNIYVYNILDLFFNMKSCYVDLVRLFFYLVGHYHLKIKVVCDISSCLLSNIYRLFERSQWRHLQSRVVHESHGLLGCDYYRSIILIKASHQVRNIQNNMNVCKTVV